MIVTVVDDTHFVSGFELKYVRVWKATKSGPWDLALRFRAHEHWVLSVAALPGGVHFVSIASDKTAKLWTLDGTLVHTFDVGWVHCVTALDAQRFVVGERGGGEEWAEFGPCFKSGYGADLALYHVDGTVAARFAGHTTHEGCGVSAVAAMADAAHLLSGGHDMTVKVWSVADKSLVSTCTGHTGFVWTVAATPDGQRILSGSEDRTIRVWQFDGAPVSTFSLLHPKPVKAVVVTPDGLHALSGSDDKTIQLWRIADGAAVRSFTQHTSGIQAIALLPDGKRFVSSSNDTTARIAEHGHGIAEAEAEAPEAPSS